MNVMAIDNRADVYSPGDAFARIQPYKQQHENETNSASLHEGI